MCIREFCEVESTTSFRLLVTGISFFASAFPDQEQPGDLHAPAVAAARTNCCSIPPERGTGKYTAVKPDSEFHPDGKLLLYEIKAGGERTGGFELLDIDSRMNSSRRPPQRISARLCLCPGLEKLLLRP